MSEPAGLAAFISLSKPAFARFLAGAGGDEAARLFAAASANPDAMLALRYVAKHRGVLFCAFDDETSPPEWLDSAAFEVCRLLAQAKDNASEDLVLVSAGILNHRVDEIAFAFAAGGGLVAPLQPVPGWDDPRLVVLDRLLEELVFAPLAKAEDRPLDKLVDASVRRLARSRLQRQLVEERASAIRAAAAAAASGLSPAPVVICKRFKFDGLVVRDHFGILAGADPHTLRVLSRLVVADAHHVWCIGQCVAEADGATFEILGGLDGIYARDGEHVFVEDHGSYRVISAADAKTFKDIGLAYARDAHHVYCRGEVLPGVGERFSLNGCGFLCGQHAVYHYDFLIPLDPATFEVLDLATKLKDTNPHTGDFRLRDRTGTYRYDSHRRTVERES